MPTLRENSVLIDSHCHIDDESFDSDRNEVLARCRQAGISDLVIPAVDAAGWDKLLQLCDNDTGLHPALGLHPYFVESHSEADLEALDRYLTEYKPVAVGEIGLDYYLPDLDRDKQQQLFEAQLRLAQQHKLPVLLHIRKAHDPVLATLKRIPVTGGIAHAFNGSMQQAQQYIDLGFKLGFGGTLTYERSRKLRALAAALPLESIVLETDAPDMVTAAHEGERNSPEYLVECLAALAEVRPEEKETLASQTRDNVISVLPRLQPQS